MYSVTKDLNQLLQPNPDQIRHMRLGSDEAQGLGLRRGDLLIIDAALRPRFGDIVVASIQGRWRPRRRQRTSGRIILSAQTFNTPDTFFDVWAQLDLLGVVTFSIHAHEHMSGKARRKSSERPAIAPL